MLRMPTAIIGLLTAALPVCAEYDRYQGIGSQLEIPTNSIPDIKYLGDTRSANSSLGSRQIMVQETGSPDRGIRPQTRQPPKPSDRDQPQANTPIPAPGSAGEFETTMWSLVKNSQDPADLDAYLELFPKGRYANLAHERLRKMKSSAHTKSKSSTRLPPEPAKRQLEPKLVEFSLQLTREERALIQRALTAKNLQVGTEDGLFGRKTRAAIRQYQAAAGLQETGFLTATQAKELIQDGKKLAVKLRPKPSVPTKPILRAHPTPVPNLEINEKSNSSLNTSNVTPSEVKKTSKSREEIERYWHSRIEALKNEGPYTDCDFYVFNPGLDLATLSECETRGTEIERLTREMRRELGS